MTKAEFERHLNETVPLGSHHNETGWGGGSGARTRPYGTYLRSADRDQFEEEYRQYLAKRRIT